MISFDHVISDSSDRLKESLSNKHLRELLLEVDSAKDQSKALEKAMQIPIFTEFVDHCLQVVEPQDDSAILDELSLA